MGGDRRALRLARADGRGDHDYATTGRWSGIDKEAFRFRRTDRFVNETVLAETGRKLWPLSVSADRLALTAWRTAQLREAEGNARAELLAAIEAKAPWLGWAAGTREACVASDDALDAVLAALIARAAALGLTVSPERGDLELARSEGWIHLPQRGSLPELCTGR